MLPENLSRSNTRDRLAHTDLTTSQKIEFSAKVLANKGLHGSVTQMS
ncbi:MAG: hypothetical protein LC437_07255 [Thiohalomonas sp.]|nr:hypothetical protein [Thiohalomonas sp.]